MRKFKQRNKKVLIEPLVDNNPITLQVLGICSAWAVTSQMSTSLIMALALTLVTAFSSAAISAPETIFQAVSGLLCNDHYRFIGYRLTRY
jgi:Na+-transporting NADH:ubiquinone oxidoreductase subunit NqrD